MKNNPHGKSVRILCGMVERAGFEPAKAMPADLQSAPFGQLGYLSIRNLCVFGRGGGIRTPNTRIWSPLLYRWSYAPLYSSLIKKHSTTMS